MRIEENIFLFVFRVLYVRVSLLMVHINAYRGFSSCSLFAIDMKGNVEANRYIKGCLQNVVTIFSLFGNYITYFRQH